MLPSKIAIDTGALHLQINDGPEYLDFNPADLMFAEKFYRMMGEFEEKRKEMALRMELIEKSETVSEAGVSDKFPEKLALIREVVGFMKGQIDVVFGEGSSQRLFGSAETVVMFENFFRAVTPLIGAVRKAKVDKYMPKRRRGGAAAK